MKNIYSFDLGHLYETLGSLSEKDRDQCAKKHVIARIHELRENNKIR